MLLEQTKDFVKASKRPLKSKDLPDAVVMKDWQGGKDDNTKTFNWSVRGMYQNPNADPRDYWQDAKDPLEVLPNMKGSLLTEHLTPLTICAKAKAWAHLATATIAIRYFTHSQSNNSSKKLKSQMSIQASGEDGENIVTIGQNWLEVDSCRELVEHEGGT